jgi:hypothetical protein
LLSGLSAVGEIPGVWRINNLDLLREGGGDSVNAHNNNCDGDNCQSATGEVRVLPYGGGGNLIVCRACYEHEMAFRKERNREAWSPFDLPAWESLAVYGAEVAA